jgi:hypothetical protein
MVERKLHYNRANCSHVAASRAILFFQFVKKQNDSIGVILNANNAKKILDTVNFTQNYLINRAATLIPSKQCCN